MRNDWNPETIDPNKLAAATHAFFEHLPLRRLAESPDRIWRSRRWGMTVEFFVLDCRSERKPSTVLGPNATQISPAQLSWLKAALRFFRGDGSVIASTVLTLG